MENDINFVSSETETEKTPLVKEKIENDFSKKSISIFKIFLITLFVFFILYFLPIKSSMGGVVFCWAVQIGYTSPFLRILGLNEEFVSLVWIAGPLSGFITQPIVGIISDSIFIPYFGRRRPWMILGVFITAISLILFSNADWISYLILGKNSQNLTIVLAIVSFFTLDFSVNFIQVSIRSLLVDIVPSHQQGVGNIFITLMSGLGNALGFGIGSIPYVQIFPFFETNVKPTFFIGLNVLIFTVLITCLSIREDDGKGKENDVIVDEEKEKIDILKEIEDDFNMLDDIDEYGYVVKKNSSSCGCGCCKKIGKYFFSIPSEFWRAYIIQFCTYVGKFVLYIYMSDYVAKQIFKGDANAPLGSPKSLQYQLGVNWASFGFFILSLSNVIYAIILRFLMNYLPYKVLWLFAQLLQSIVLFICPFIYDKWSIFAIFAILGIVETNLNSMPWAIVNSSIRSAEVNIPKGFFSALFNTSQVLPQFLTALAGTWISYLFNYWNLPPGAILAIGGVTGGISCVLIFLFAKIPKELKDVNWSEKKLEQCWNIFKKKKENSVKDVSIQNK